mmetsp:Transcript_36247/g.94291  ORF Transcript_36247/g.94291 Transcript_36247/m.94291 type:complete len:108 (+) Transcript_36247:724-1047(+)
MICLLFAKATLDQRRRAQSALYFTTLTCAHTLRAPWVTTSSSAQAMVLATNWQVDASVKGCTRELLALSCHLANLARLKTVNRIMDQTGAATEKDREMIAMTGYLQL